ncbi:hypothetical protein TRVL_08194 [Trypanosoma vivax]|nr:hypothetical protein TRVL_08194 [Trypanosoma vivax]
MTPPRPPVAYTMGDVSHSNSTTASLSSGGVSLSFLIVFRPRKTALLSRSKGAPIKPYFLERQLLSPSAAPHCLTPCVATGLHFSTPRRGPLVRTLPIHARIFINHGAAHLKLTTAVSCANARATARSISGSHPFPNRGRVSSTGPPVSARQRKLARPHCGRPTWKKSSFRSNTAATSQNTAPR